jgi:serine/threonine protein kinase/formylglycine-generating enzyme required for sulfatase activity
MTADRSASDQDDLTGPMERFLSALWEDFDSGRVKPFAEYFARFPGDENAMRREYSAILAVRRPESSPVDAAAAAGLETEVGDHFPRLVDPDLGRRLGPWRLLREIGRGGQGAVYLAEDARLRRKAAVKVLTSTGFTGAALDRFKREAAVAARLDHPGICAVYDVGLEGRTPYIAMRYVEGETLAQRIESTRARAAAGGAPLSHIELPSTGAAAEEVRPATHGHGAKPAPRARRASEPRAADPNAPSTQIELSRILRLIEQTARIVHAAHEAGVIHRDLKPGNIIVTAEGEPVVLDFGLAKDTSGLEATLTQEGDLMGTPAYMSPEQIAAHRISLDRRTDVYSLGVTLFECITLRRPFDAPTRDGLYQAILTKTAPDPRTFNRAIPADLKVVLETALDKDRERRYATALDFAEDLRRVRCFEPITARPASAITKLARWARRSPALAAALFGLFVVLTAGIVVAVVLLGQKDGALSEANAERVAKVAALGDFERLAVVSRLQALEAEREAVWPLTEKNHLRRKEWLRKAEALVAELPQHEATLARLRVDAMPQATDSVEFEDATSQFVDLTFGALGPTSTDTLGSESRPDSQPTTRRLPFRSRFADPAKQFKHDVLAKFVDDMRQFAAADRFHRKYVGMRRQDEHSDRFLRLLTGDHRPLWDEAIASIRDASACPLYKGLVLAPQFGLVPIGRNPQSGLWEFMDLGTLRDGVDPMPVRRADGTLDYKPDHGVVFVLLPGGDALIGSRVATKAEREAKERGEPTSPEIDWAAEADESPQHSVSLESFFISKYELTQGQWERLTGMNPSEHRENGVPRPVESVSWYACVRWTRFAAMSLPTEAQWEYGCRAGTTTPRKTGAIFKWMTRAALAFGAFGMGAAPVGSRRANAFGLHDTYGNVGEWCRDGYVWYDASPPRPGDGLRGEASSEHSRRVYRGSSYVSSDFVPRSAGRFEKEPQDRSYYCGLRPSRRIAAP